MQLHTEVARLEPLSAAAAAAAGGGGDGSSAAPPDWLRWRVTTRPAAQQGAGAYAASNNSSSSTRVFDAVVVANGHYSVPRFPQLPGLAEFPGLVMHAHNYRRPERFGGQTVVLVGASSSGVDIAEEIAASGAKR